MARGFMELVVRIIQEFPGQTAEWYAEEALDRGIVSRAKDPVQSLANTLAKQVREGREPRVRRVRIGGKFRYFSTLESDEEHLENTVVEISLSAQEISEVLDNLIAVGKCSNRSDAIMWLAKEGIKARSDYLDKVADARKQIERIKAGVS